VAVSSGTRFGPYEILEPLGAGGMGEVYRARDSRLDREVAVKVLRAEVASDPDRLRRFEREAKTVAALNHPHILTVHDVGTHDGTPYVVTELLEGESLRQVLKSRAPTQRQVLAFAVQIARGLAAAHDKDIVHRDLKPENLFLTTDGRIKILDFGLAKLTTPEADFRSAATLGASEEHSTSPGVILGTVAYMSPEQAQAHPLDNRSDIFSFGVVLYEMLAHRHPFLRDTAPATLTAIVNDTPPDLASTGRGIPPALGGIVRRCLEKKREDRFRTTHDLALALEAVLHAPSGAASLQEVEERSPYPGLSSFTERDAAVFFGREGEVAALWKKLRSRHLLAVIGPSGAGKSSFVRAGVLPARPEGWAALVCAPGRHPFRRLGQALGPELTGDAEALGELAGFEDPETALSLLTRWRKGHDEALVVVDQFEELFTQSPPESQAAFAELLGRLSKEAEVHVLLSLRDDFLMRCHQHEPLARVFSELTPLDTLSRDGLRRAIAEPARKQGYAFEDDALVDEMVGSVEGARGALPLLAFAVSQLWERRDREAKRLTRAAYEEIGGVAGALAQHAEHTLERIGLEREPIVRELFRNLVTAQWTRAAADREELLSVLPDRHVGEEVLDQLIDARLLTSYEVRPEPGRDGAASSEESVYRIEIVHESLLKAWPRLVRWQAQDEEGAVLRDQLKQAAHLWEERGRSEDLLWSGTAHREFELWRERYPGALTALEEDFARAMAERARRQRRLRRIVGGSVVAAALAVAGVTGVLWRRSEAAREAARAEAQRTEAGKLLALAQTYLEDDRTAALAYARGSLVLADTPEARRFVLEVLWRGPVARVLDVREATRPLGLPEAASYFGEPVFSPDGRWMANNGESGPVLPVLLFDRGGSPPRALPPEPDGKAGAVGFGPQSDLLVAGGPAHSLKLWSLPDLRELRTVPLGPGLGSWGGGGGGRVVVITALDAGGQQAVQRIDLPDGPARVVARLSLPREVPWGKFDAQADHALVTTPGGGVGLHALDGTNRLRILGRVPYINYPTYSLDGRLVAVIDRSGAAWIWSTAVEEETPLRTLQGPEFNAQGWAMFDPAGRRLSHVGPNGTHTVWDLEAFPDARPLVVGRPGPTAWRQGSFGPAGRWLALGGRARTTVEFWPIESPRRRELPGFADALSLAFSRDSRWLATCPFSNPGRLWPASLTEGRPRTIAEKGCNTLAIDPSTGSVLIGTRGRVALHPFLGGAPRVLLKAWEKPRASLVGFDASGRRAMATPLRGYGDQSAELRVVRLWDLETGEEREHSIAHLTDAQWNPSSFAFAPDDRLYLSGPGGVRRLTLPSGPDGTVSAEMIHAAGFAGFDLSRDGRLMLVSATRQPRASDPREDLLLLDLAAGTTKRITSHGTELLGGVLSPSARAIVTGGHDGILRVGPVTGGEPHLLFGHKGPIRTVVISPDERWIASSSSESISIWPMPDVTQPPLHTLPHEELLAKLDALTNLRVVRDPSSPTGWREEIGPFPGWKDVPTW
jgi:WD40 repeat protein